MKNTTKVEENIVEIAWLCTGPCEDSMVMKQKIIEWAHEFEEEYKDVDWDVDKRDYVTEIEKFTNAKLIVGGGADDNQ